ncbi:MAG TPA: glutamate--tRNA ligase [Jatrophihabitantaceae bacterium]|jgi:glutamyl-tRNA synthetase
MTVRVRFAPSPSGDLHVGNVRTALFNWAYARHSNGTFVFRVEDTDAARSTDESYARLLDDLRWLGLDWDEGPETGGPYGPYRQSERRDVYAEVAARLLKAGHAYESYSTPEEVEARHRAAGRDPKLGYDGFDRLLTDEQRAAYQAEGRAPVLRIRMPDEDVSWDDLVRGEITFAAGSVPDFVVVRGNGDPLYTLTNPVDDALMRITHVLRGEDLTSSTPRQIVLYRALIDIGVTDFVPQFGHLPFVMGEGNRKLSKRAPEGSLSHYREAGYLPDGLLNYLALLGWSIGPDRDVFTRDEFVAAFDIADVNANPARFDPKKCEVINAAHLRLLSADEFARALAPWLPDASPELIEAAAPLVQERVQTLSEAAGMLRFLVDDEIEIVDAAKLDPAVITAAVPALEALPSWDTAAIEAALRTALVDGLGLKPRNAFGPIRVAITGRTVSPPLFESLELLGRDRSLARLHAALA